MIRALRSGDVAGISALEAELFGADAWSTSGLTELLEGPGRRAWVAVSGDRLDGYALTGLVGDFAELLRIGVAGRAQRLGVAGGLLDEALAAARDDGADRMLLEVSAANEAALALYAARGFARIDVRPRYYRDGADALVLARPLGAQLDVSGRMDP